MHVDNAMFCRFPLWANMPKRAEVACFCLWLMGGGSGKAFGTFILYESKLNKAVAAAAGTRRWALHHRHLTSLGL
jgi:hypothetical protein